MKPCQEEEIKKHKVTNPDVLGPPQITHKRVNPELKIEAFTFKISLSVTSGSLSSTAA